MAQKSQPPVDVPDSPDWPGLRALAAGQAGYFTAAQAAERGFSAQLLSKHAASGTLERPLRGIYRLAHFPPGEHEDLVVAWLWSGGLAVVSHESALQLHELSDAMPARIHLTLPLDESGRRRVVPDTYVLHFADLADADRAWVGPVAVTTPVRAVLDVAAANGDAGLVAQAIDQGIDRELFRLWDVVPAVEYARSFDTPHWRVFPEAVADLGDSWFMRGASGICARRPPADWPRLARETAERHGGRVYWQMYHPRTGTMGLHVAWSQPGPDAAVEGALRQDFAEVFEWR